MYGRSDCVIFWFRAISIFARRDPFLNAQIIANAWQIFASPFHYVHFWTILISLKMLGSILLFSLPAVLVLVIEYVSDVSFNCAQWRLESFVSKRDDPSRKECYLNCLQMMPAVTHLFKAWVPRRTSAVKWIYYSWICCHKVQQFLFSREFKTVSTRKPKIIYEKDIKRKKLRTKSFGIKLFIYWAKQKSSSVNSKTWPFDQFTQSAPFILMKSQINGAGRFCTVFFCKNWY